MTSRRKLHSITSQYTRGNIAKYIIIFLFVLVWFRLIQIQLLNASKYKSIAREQHWSVITLPAKRGSIYTSDNFPVATSVKYYYPKIDVLRVKEVEDTTDFFIDTLENKDMYKSFKVAYENGSKIFDLNLKLNYEEKLKFEEDGYNWLYFDEAYERYYPENTMLSQVLGFLGRDTNNEEVGYYGLEQRYDGYLAGQDGWVQKEKTAAGYPILWGGVDKLDPQDGSDLHLTIDRKVQYIIESHLKRGVEKYYAKTGTVVVLDPKTGAVLGMANYPDYNPAQNRDELDLDVIRNNAISSVYEPGSVVKAITMSTAISLGKVDPETTYNDTGPRTFSGYKVDNWDGKHHGVISMTRILQLSNNLGISWVAQQVGSEDLIRNFHSFGFGEYSGIDLEGEEKGLLYADLPLKDIELANTSFGQGMSATPLQVAMAFSAIANEGKLMKPYVVSSISSKDGTMAEIRPEIIDKPISEQTSKTMVEMLTAAVSGGEAKYFVSKKYNIAGKTGTAQVPISGGYDASKTNATFVGFFPNYRNFVMLVKLEEPSAPSGYAAETAVPLWMAIAEDIAHYYGLTPDRLDE